MVKDLKTIFKLLLFPFVFLLCLTGTVFGASSVPIVSISPAANSVVWGTDKVNLTLTVNPEANVSAITVYYTNSYSGDGTIGIDVNISSSILTISTAGIPSGTDFNITLTSVQGDGAGQSDGTIGAGTATITITNRAPEANNKNYKVCPNDSIPLTGNIITDDLPVGDSDPDGNPISLAENNSTSEINIADDGMFDYTPQADFYGIYSFDYTITDGDLNSSSATIGIYTLQNTPTGVDEYYVTAKESTLSGENVLENDLNTTGYTVSISQPPSDGNASLNPDGSFSYTPNNDYSGEDSFTYSFSNTDCNTTVEATAYISVMCAGVSHSYNLCGVPSVTPTEDVVKGIPQVYYYTLQVASVVEFDLSNTGDEELQYDLQKSNCSLLFESNTSSSLKEGKSVHISKTYPAGTYFLGFFVKQNRTSINMSICADENLSGEGDDGASSYIGINDAGNAYDSFPYIRTKTVNKEFGLRASYLGENGKVANYNGSDPLSIDLYLADKSCKKTRIDPIIEWTFTNGDPYRETTVDRDGNPNLIAYAARERAYKITAFDTETFNRLLGLDCSGSSANSPYCKLPACLDSEIKIEEAFPPAFFPHVLVCLGSEGGTAPCSSSAYNSNCGGKTKTITPDEYNHDLGCFECLYDAAFPPTCSDPFAIRPKAFDVNISNGNIFKAGKEYSFEFDAHDFNDKPSNEYDENQSTAFYVDLNVSIDNRDCQKKNLTIDPPVDFKDGRDVGNFSFDDIGDINISIHESNGTEFAIVDVNDTTWVDRHITEYNATFTVIPDHFHIEANLTDHNDADHFTYLHDINRYDTDDNYSMASVLSVNIKAVGAVPNENITRNYTENCYANETNITLVLNESNISYPGSVPALTHFLYYNPVEENGTVDGEGNYSFPSPITSPITLSTLPIENQKSSFPADPAESPDGNGSTHIEYKLNFNRKMNLPVNPFMLEMIEANITDTDNVTGKEEDDSNATFYYARVKPSKIFYDDEPAPAATTAITLVVYRDIGTSDFSLLFTPFKPTNEYDWYLSTRHTSADGNVTLVLKESTQGSVAPANPTITEGINSNIKITAVSAGRPLIVDINLTGTDPWLIYNPDANSEPNPFYRVRFIGEGGWAGHGDTRDVVEGNTNIKKNRRLEW